MVYDTGTTDYNCNTLKNQPNLPIYIMTLSLLFLSILVKPLARMLSGAAGLNQCWAIFIPP